MFRCVTCRDLQIRRLISTVLLPLWYHAMCSSVTLVVYRSCILVLKILVQVSPHCGESPSVRNYSNASVLKTNKMHFSFLIYFHNLSSACFEQSNCSSLGGSYCTWSIYSNRSSTAGSYCTCSIYSNRSSSAGSYCTCSIYRNRSSSAGSYCTCGIYSNRSSSAGSYCTCSIYSNCLLMTNGYCIRNM